MRKEMPYYDLIIVTEIVNGVKSGLKTKDIADILNSKGLTTISGKPFSKNYLELQFHLSRFPAKVGKPKLLLSVLSLIRRGLLNLADATYITAYTYKKKVSHE